MSGTSSNSKNHTKKTNSTRERDKNKSVASESGGSQCDTPPLPEKDGNTSQGKYAGISPDSIMCMAEQVGAELNSEAATNLAEDVSYKLRQTISTLALHSEMLKKSRVDTWDVNTVLTLSDTSPVVGACTPQYTLFCDEKLICQLETLVNITDYALAIQTYSYTTTPTLSVEWITNDANVNNANSNINVSLQNYYTKVARAILNLRKKPKDIAVEDLMTNTRIGPIFPNLFNLAVLVLNDENLNALNVPAKKPLQSNVLDMVDALCSNPCSLDTNIQQQFQRLFPVMVSNILGNGSLAEKMVAILTKIIRTWPSFITIGKGILFEYLSQGPKERLTAPMIKCVTALGRRALVECLGDHLDHIDECIHRPRLGLTQSHSHLRETILDASTCLLRSEPMTYLEDYVMTDYTLYEMLGDSIAPRRTLFPFTDAAKSDNATEEKSSEEEYIPLKPVMRRPKLRIVDPNEKTSKIPRDLVFKPTKFKSDACLQIKIRNCMTLVTSRRVLEGSFPLDRRHSVVVASGLLNKFRYRLKKSNNVFPTFGALIL